VPSRKDPDASANVPSFYGAELRFKRELAGLTLEQLAEGSFRGIPFLSQIERGERRMPLDLAVHVDKVLGTDGFFERRCEDARKARQSGPPQRPAHRLSGPREGLPKVVRSAQGRGASA